MVLGRGGENIEKQGKEKKEKPRRGYNGSRIGKGGKD